MHIKTYFVHWPSLVYVKMIILSLCFLVYKRHSCLYIISLLTLLENIYIFQNLQLENKLIIIQNAKFTKDSKGETIWWRASLKQETPATMRP